MIRSGASAIYLWSKSSKRKKENEKKRKGDGTKIKQTGRRYKVKVRKKVVVAGRWYESKHE